MSSGFNPGSFSRSTGELPLLIKQDFEHFPSGRRTEEWDLKKET